jgi:preprotein translocase subunit SecB
MADETPQQPVDPNAPVFAPQAVYVKDLSYEAPQGPRLPGNGVNPTINLNLNTSVNELGPDLREVVLTVNVQAVIGDKTLWLVELQQAGAFAVRNVPAPDLQRLMGIYSPNYLLPYARQTISDLLLKGGFPPFLLPPVNFDMLFEQAQQQGQQPASQDATALN